MITIKLKNETIEYNLSDLETICFQDKEIRFIFKPGFPFEFPYSLN